MSIGYFPFKHDEHRVIPLECEREIENTIRELVAKETATIHRDLVPWASVATEVMQTWVNRNRGDDYLGGTVHWHWYSQPSRLVIFLTLSESESFLDIHPLYERIAAHVEQMKGGYKEHCADPDPVDDTQIRWRKWDFKLGDSTLQLNVSFGYSRHCRLVVDGTEIVEKTRVVCEPAPEQIAAE